MYFPIWLNVGPFVWVNQGSKWGRKNPLDPCQRISLSATSGAGEAELALGFFSTRLHFDALAARSGKGRSREKREKKEKALIHRETRSAYLSLLCLAFTAVSSSSSLFALGGINAGICGGITQNRVSSPPGSFQQIFILAISFLRALYVLYLRKQRKKCNPNNTSASPAKFLFWFIENLSNQLFIFYLWKTQKISSETDISMETSIFDEMSFLRCFSWRILSVLAEKKRVGDRTKTKLPGKHAMLQVNGLKCQLVNCHKAREVNQSTRVNGAMLIYTEDLALDFNRTSLASCFSAYPSSSLFNKLSVILGLSFNNSPFSPHDPSSLSGDNGMGFSACSPHRNIVDRLNSAQLATGF